MNYEIRKASFEDALFVRLKAEKSFRLPQSPQKNALIQSKSPPFDVNSLINSMFNSSKGSFIEKIKRLKTKPSKDQVHQWIVEKQIQIKSIISKEKQFIQRNIISCSDKILLRPKQQLTRADCTTTTKNKIKMHSELPSKELSQSKSLKQKSSTFWNNRKDHSFSQLKLTNHKPIVSFQHVSESHQKLNEKLLKTPVSYRRNSVKSVVSNVSLLQSSLSQQKNRNHSNLSMFESQVYSKQNYGKEKVLLKETKQRSSTVKQLSPKKIEEKKFINQISPSQKNSNGEATKQPFKSTLYSVQGLSPLKKYNGRQLSPNEWKGLKGKFFNLQSRLDNLLKGEKKQKK